MTFKKFKYIIKLIGDEHSKSDKLNDLGINLIYYTSNYCKIIESLLVELFGEDNVELIYWWLYDSSDKTVTFNNTEYDLTHIKDLYNYITNIG